MEPPSAAVRHRPESIGILFDGVAYTEVGGVALGMAFNSGRIAAQSAVSAIQ